MTTERTRTERGEVLSADLDRFAVTRGLWTNGAAISRHEALCDAVRAAVAEALTEKQREVIEAHFFEGLTQGEIARQLGVSQQVVQKRIYGTLRGGRLVGGAIHRLRQALAPLSLLP